MSVIGHFQFQLWEISAPKNSLELPFPVSIFWHGCYDVPRGWGAHWSLLYWKHCTGIPRYRHIFKPLLSNLENNWNVMAFFCWQGRAEICLDTFHYRCTLLRCRSSKPKKTLQETTDVRSPIRISLTAVHLILKYMVRELSCPGKCDFFFLYRVCGDRAEEGHLILRDFKNKVSFKNVCVSNCGTLSKPSELNYETI